MSTLPEISQLVIEETLEWQKPLIHNLVCECVDIPPSQPNVFDLVIEWEDYIDDDINFLFLFTDL